MIDVEITSLTGGETVQRDFVAVHKEHIRIAFPIEEVA